MKNSMKYLVLMISFILYLAYSLPLLILQWELTNDSTIRILYVFITTVIITLVALATTGLIIQGIYKYKFRDFDKIWLKKNNYKIVAYVLWYVFIAGYAYTGKVNELILINQLLNIELFFFIHAVKCSEYIVKNATSTLYISTDYQIRNVDIVSTTESFVEFKYLDGTNMSVKRKIYKTKEKGEYDGCI